MKPNNLSTHSHVHRPRWSNYKTHPESKSGILGQNDITVKARVNNFGKASALIQHQFRPKSFFTVSADVDIQAVDISAKAGLAFALEP